MFFVACCVPAQDLGDEFWHGKDALGGCEAGVGRRMDLVWDRLGHVFGGVKEEID